MARVAPRDIAVVAVTRLLSTDWWSGHHVRAVHDPTTLASSAYDVLRPQL